MEGRKTFQRSLLSRLTFLILLIILTVSKTYLFHLRHLPTTNTSMDDNLAFPPMPMSENTQDFNHRRHLLTMKVIRPPPEANCTPLAMENFPKDLFTQRARHNGAVILHIIASIYMFIALAILCDDYFIPCLERICEVLNLQPDVAGATFMAAGSSAPELATTLVGVFIAKDDIGLGAVVGSADFNVMLVVSVTALFAKRVIYLNWWPLVRDCSFYLLSIVILALVIVDEFIYWYEALVFLLFYVGYVVLMYFNPRLDRFWKEWCRLHPNCCPRAIHSESEEQEIRQQHTGAFINPAIEDDDHMTRVPAVKYTRFDELEKVIGDSEMDNKSTEFHEGLEQKTADASSFSELDPQIATADDSWFMTCFGPLQLPKSQGVRGKLCYAASLFVWPIRLVLCLTVPDVRKDKWRRLFFSHWIAFVVCCVWIGVFTIVMMWMITVIGVTFHIPDTIMGLTFIAAGSSVPDAITSILVVREGEGDMAVSNAVGSNVFDILVCMGLPWFLKCLTSGAPVIVYSKGLFYAVMTLFSTVMFLLLATHLNRWRLTKTYGVVLLLGYFVVLAFCSCYELNLFGTVHLPECPLVE